MEEASYKEIELFIREELSQHGEWLIDRFVEVLERNGNVDTGTLIESFNYETGSRENGTQTLEVSFMTYGRAMEIMARKRKKRIKEGKNREVWAKKNHKRAKKVQWYNRNRYAGYRRLIERIAAGMSDDELKRIRGILEHARKDLQQ